MTETRKRRVVRAESRLRDDVIAFYDDIVAGKGRHPDDLAAMVDEFDRGAQAPNVRSVVQAVADKTRRARRHVQAHRRQYTITVSAAMVGMVLVVFGDFLLGVLGNLAASVVGPWVGMH